MAASKNVGVIIIGDEILSGRRQDKHLPKMIELLAARGMRLSWARLCGDDRPRLIETLKQTFASNDLVFSFGGIGATPDDHTRQCAALAAGVELALHPEAEREIRARFGVETTDYRLLLGTFPQGSRVIPNPYNRIPGFSFADHHFVPGFPEMSWPMVEWVLDQQYAHLHHADAWVEDSIAVFEALEGQIVDLMASLEQEYGVTIFSLPNLGNGELRAHIELGAKGEPDAVAAAMTAMRAEIERRGFPWGVMENMRSVT